MQLSLIPVLGLLLVQAPESELPSVSERPAGNAELERGIQLLSEHEVKRAVEVLQQVTGPLRLADAVRHAENLGIGLAYSGRVDEAKRVFKRLLAIAPGHVMPYTVSPKATFVFEEARTEMAKLRATEVKVLAPQAIPFAEKIEVSSLCTANALDLMQSWELCFRIKGQGKDYICQPAAPSAEENTAKHLLPAIPATAATDSEQQVILQLAVLGYDSDGNEVYQGPSKSRPQEVVVGVEVPGPWYSNYWLWGAVAASAAAAVAGGVALYFVLRPNTVSISGELVEE